MSNYRSDVNDILKESRWTFWRVFPSVLLIVIVLTGLGFGARSLGLFGETVVERVIFEQSYQRSESIKARIAVDEAVLKEIQMKLSNPGLDENTVYNLKAQAGAARLRIATARGIE